MNMVGKLLVVSFFWLAALIGCSKDPSSSLEVSGEGGSIDIQLVADAASNFSDVATTAEVRISGEGMPTITRPLTVTTSGISGTITGIPAGTDREFEVFVYDELNRLCYYGNAVGEVTVGGTANVSLTLFETSGEGNATINGTIQSSNIPPTVSITSPANNAQFTVGSTVAIAATAADADGSVGNVAFYSGATLLATDNTAPYSCNFTPSTAGTYTLSAVATDNKGATTTSALVTVTVKAVTLVSYKINCGGSAVSPYAADGYYSGGSTSSTTSTITITGVTNPAPTAVYQKERYGNVTYTFPNLVSGLTYNVRLHFAEIYWTASAKRRFNVAINGSQVLTNFDIYATAGAAKKAVVREFTATANSSGQIVVTFTTVTDNASVCGIEILPNQVQTFTVTYNSNGGSGTAPVDANSYTYGSTATIKPNSGALVSGTSSFAGWNTSGGITYVCGQTITITGNVQLTARYSETEIMDNDGNLYTSIVIGGMEWLLQNLKTTKYRDGSSIPYVVTNGTDWRLNAVVGGSPTCAWADFNSSNNNYGMMYNSIVLEREVAPAGWRIATQADWEYLYSVAESNACQLINWTSTCSGSPGEINATGFSLFESGYIYQYNTEPGYWNNSNAYLWTSNPSGTYASFSRAPGGVVLSYYDIDGSANNARGYGCAIRCVKINPNPFNVTYNSNGGTGTVPTDFTDYTIGSTATIKANPGALVKGSSSFVGWMTSGGTTYACGQTVTITGNLQLYAKYSETEVMDNDGNVYTSKVIGGRRWLLQSLKTTKYRNATAINYFVTNGTDWRSHAVVGGSPTCAWPGFSSSNSNYGMLYNSIAVENQPIAPAGWRIATQADWEDLYSAASNNACQLINWTGTCSGSPGELNLTGFSLSESGYIYQWETDPGYWNNSNAYLWTSNPTNTYANFFRAPGGVGISYYDIYGSANNARGYGCAIRCVKE